MKIIKKLCGLITYKCMKIVAKRCKEERKMFDEAGLLSDESKKAEIQRRCYYRFKRGCSIINNSEYLKMLDSLPDFYKKDIEKIQNNLEKF